MHWNFVRFFHGWQATNLTTGKSWMLHDGDVLSYTKYVPLLNYNTIERVVIDDNTRRDKMAEALEEQNAD